MIALFDSGNTRLHFGWWDGSVLIDPVSVPYPASHELLNDFVMALFAHRKPHRAAACSVNSRWREPLFRAIYEVVKDGLFTARKASDFGLNVYYENPAAYGVDRALAAYAAYEMYYRDSCIIIDAGTAVTVDAVAQDGTVLGGYIFPGAEALIHGLSSLTDLPSVKPDFDSLGIGRTTEQCISCAAAMGLTGAITRLVAFLGEIIGTTDRVIITGGGAEAIMKQFPFRMTYRRFLVLEGLGYAFERLPKYA